MQLETKKDDGAPPSKKAKSQDDIIPLRYDALYLQFRKDRVCAYLADGKIAALQHSELMLETKFLQKSASICLLHCFCNVYVLF